MITSIQKTKKYIIYDSKDKVVISTDNFKYYEEILANSKNFTGDHKDYNYNLEKNKNLAINYSLDKHEKNQKKP